MQDCICDVSRNTLTTCKHPVESFGISHTYVAASDRYPYRGFALKAFAFRFGSSPTLERPRPSGPKSRQKIPSGSTCEPTGRSARFSTGSLWARVNSDCIQISHPALFCAARRTKRGKAWRNLHCMRSRQRNRVSRERGPQILMIGVRAPRACAPIRTTKKDARVRPMDTIDC